MSKDIYAELIEQLGYIRCACIIYAVVGGKLYEVDKNFDPPRIKEIKEKE